MSHLSISDLSSNYLNTAIAIKKNENPHEVLIPGIYNDCLYIGGIQKHILQAIYSVWERFQPGIKQQRFNLAILKTHQSLIQILHDLSNDKINTTVWNNWMTPVLRQAIFPNLQKIIDFFDHHLGVSTENVWIYGYPIMRNLAKEQHIISTEVKTQFPVPSKSLIRILKCIEDHKAVTTSDSKLITDWMKKLTIGGLRGRVQVRSIHKTIKAVVRKELKLKDETLIMQKTALIEWYLEQKGSTVFQQEDKKQLDFCRNFLKNKQLKYMHDDVEKTIVVSNVKGSDIINDENEHVVVEIQNSNQKLMRLPKNCTRAGIEWVSGCMQEKNQPKLIEMKEIDLKGRFYFVHRYDLSLENYEWPKNDELSNQDKKVFSALITMIKAFNKEQYLPEKLRIEDLKIDLHPHTASIVITNPQPQMEYDFNRVENFIYDTAKGGKNSSATWENRAWLYKKLMTASMMHEKPIAIFYKNFVEAILTDAKFNPKLEVASLHENEQTSALDKALQLEGLLRRMIEHAENHLKKFPSKENLLKDFKKALLDRYLDIGCAGCLWPSIENEALQIVIEKHGLGPKKLKENEPIAVENVEVEAQIQKPESPTRR